MGKRDATGCGPTIDSKGDLPAMLLQILAAFVGVGLYHLIAHLLGERVAIAVALVAGVALLLGVLG